MKRAGNPVGNPPSGGGTPRGFRLHTRKEIQEWEIRKIVSKQENELASKQEASK